MPLTPARRKPYPVLKFLGFLFSTIVSPLHAKTWLHETVGRVTPHIPCQTPALLCDHCEREIFTRQKKTKNSRKVQIMKQKLQIIIVSASAASLLAFSGLAQDTANTQTNVTDNNQANESDTNRTNAVDNTARNVRDRNDRTLTPLDQGNSQADVNTTAQIRKEIIAGKNMSVNARNVKIITIDGRSTPPRKNVSSVKSRIGLRVPRMWTTNWK